MNVGPALQETLPQCNFITVLTCSCNSALFNLCYQMQTIDCAQLCFRIPLTAGAQEVLPANSREPDTECATQYVSYTTLNMEAMH